MNALMPEANPPKIYSTADNIEWRFFQTFPDYDILDKFRHNNHTYSPVGNEESRQIRFYCKRRKLHKCQFMLLALKTTKKGFHVYKRGEYKHHNHLLALTSK
jgi:hypothetical protein